MSEDRAVLFVVDDDHCQGRTSPPVIPECQLAGVLDVRRCCPDSG